MGNPLKSLQQLGQSVWLDDLHRSLITSGRLQQLIEEDGLKGLSSNPSIFEKAIDDSDEYLDILEDPESKAIDSKTLYERIVIRDIQEAADVFRPLYLASIRRDGFVSLEVSPRLSRDLRGTLIEARRLWQMVARENLMIKIPATPESIPAIQELISEGINVNITLIFTKEVYEQVATAYLFGLESFALKGGDLSTVASVASVPIGCLDEAINQRISERWEAASLPEMRTSLSDLSGKVAIANAKTIYQKHLEIIAGDRWQRLSLQGANTQRLVWIDTGMKNVAYTDVFYAEQLIGPDTINAMPPDTFASFKDHGHARATLSTDVEQACDTMKELVQLGIPFEDVAQQLLSQGVEEFTDAFTKLLTTISRSNASSFDPVTFLRFKLFKDFYGGRGLS
ncbi:MAG: transaldolase [Holophaga sp.]|nr:transaldolase [Holophaga sp.]